MSFTLHKFQKEVIRECIIKGSGGISLPMGSGKTIISITVALKQTLETEEQILVVLSKSLIGSWEEELSLRFPEISVGVCLTTTQVMNMKRYKVVLVTPGTLVKWYKLQNIREKVTGLQDYDKISPYTRLCPIEKPVSTGYFYGTTFGTIIVDEAHLYSNIKTYNCQAIYSVHARNRWVLSGTLFAEPRTTNIMGFYYLIGGNKGIPNTLGEMDVFVSSERFQGVGDKLVARKENDMFIDRPELIKSVISCEVSGFDRKVFDFFRKLSTMLSNELKSGETDGTLSISQLRGLLAGILCYSRMAIVCPIIPISAFLLRSQDYGETISEFIKKSGIEKDLEDEANLVNHRFRMIFDLLEKRIDDRVIIFCSFSVILHYFRDVAPDFCNGREIFMLESSMSCDKRTKEISRFKNSKNGVLLLSYQIGTEGLNLQCANVGIMLDTWWNESKTKQSVARMFRYGQKKDVHIYMLLSNTMFERTVFQKHRIKKSCQEFFMDGDRSRLLNENDGQLTLKSLLDNVEESVEGIDLAKESI